MARLSLGSLTESFDCNQAPLSAPQAKASYWCVGTDVTPAVKDVVSRSAPSTGRTWLLVVEKDGGNFSEFLKRFVSSSATERGAYLVKNSSESEASQFVRTRAAKPPADAGRVVWLSSAS